MKKEYIEKEEFTKIKDQALIIDVRDKVEYQTLKTFPNSVNIPYKDLITEPEKYISDKNKLIIIYCNFGYQNFFYPLIFLFVYMLKTYDRNRNNSQ